MSCILPLRTWWRRRHRVFGTTANRCSRPFGPRRSIFSARPAIWHAHGRSTICRNSLCTTLDFSTLAMRPSSGLVLFSTPGAEESLRPCLAAGRVADAPKELCLRGRLSGSCPSRAAEWGSLHAALVSACYRLPGLAVLGARYLEVNLIGSGERIGVAPQDFLPIVRAFPGIHPPLTLDGKFAPIARGGRSSDKRRVSVFVARRRFRHGKEDHKRPWLSRHHLLAHKKEAGARAVVLKPRGFFLIRRRTHFPFAVVELQRRVGRLVHGSARPERRSPCEEVRSYGEQREHQPIALHRNHLRSSSVPPLGIPAQRAAARMPIAPGGPSR